MNPRSITNETSEEKKDAHEFETYARHLLKVPTESLYKHFLNEERSSNNNLTSTEIQYINARKTWTNIVSQTNRYNSEYSTQNNVKQQVINRIKELGHQQHAEKILNQAIDYLQHASVVYTFNAKFLKKGLTDYQPLNIFQKPENKTSQYQNYRKSTEDGLFKFLTPELKQALGNNIHARPRYAALILDSVQAINCYGSSYAILNKKIAFNCLFNFADSMNEKALFNKDIIPCSYHHMEIMLLQCHTSLLKAIIQKVIHGTLPSNYPQQITSNVSEGGYIEVMIPPINLLDPTVAQFYINENEFKLSVEDISTLTRLGITFTNCLNNPYPMLAGQFIKNIDTNNLSNARQLLIFYPSLAYHNLAGEEPIHIASRKGYIDIVNLLRQHHVDINRLSVRGKAPLHYAIESGNLSFLLSLLEAPDINIDLRTNELNSEYKERTALLLACELPDMPKQLKCLTKIISAINLNHVNYKAFDGESALFKAVKQGSIDKVNLLLSIPQIDIEAARIPGDGKTTFQIAAEKNYHSILFKLLTQQYASKVSLEELKFIVLNHLIDAEFNSYVSSNPIRIQSVHSLRAIFKELTDNHVLNNKLEVVMGFLMAERERANTLHKKQWILFKKIPEFAMRIDNAIKNFSLYLNTSGLEFSVIAKNTLIQTYYQYQQQNNQSTQAQIIS